MGWIEVDMVMVIECVMLGVEEVCLEGKGFVGRVINVVKVINVVVIG